MTGKIWPWSNFTLADFSTHNLIEHDNSLFHYDVDTGHDPSELNHEWVNQLIEAAGESDFISRDVLIDFRKKRTAENHRANPHIYLNSVSVMASSFEVGLILDIFGRNKQISIEYLKSFIVDEKIPDDYQKIPRTFSPCTSSAEYNETVSAAKAADTEAVEISKLKRA